MTAPPAALIALIARFARLPPADRARLADELSPAMRRTLNEAWDVFGHDGQIEPAGAWRTWAIVAGRGFGKTRAGAEWVSAIARGNPAARIALVGHTAEDVRRVMVEGTSGILSVARDDEAPRWSSYQNAVTFSNGAKAFAYSAEAPEKLRGPEHHAAWCDELAKWREETPVWDNLQLGLRLGEAPRVLVTTTPRSVALLRRVLAARDTVTTRGRTTENLNLPPGFLAAMADAYGGTRLGRQELDGELFDDAEGALFPRALLATCRVAAATPAALGLVRVVVGVDPPASVTGDACGIVACGVDAAGIGYVLADASVTGLSPEGWARAVAACAAVHGADRVVAEKNNGGDMVKSVLTAADARLPVRLVHASRGKSARAEPIAALYERGMVKHVGTFQDLEDELAGLLVAGGYAGRGSPDRADACVWALSELLLRRWGPAAVRGF